MGVLAALLLTLKCQFPNACALKIFLPSKKMTFVVQPVQPHLSLVKVCLTALWIQKRFLALAWPTCGSLAALMQLLRGFYMTSVETLACTEEQEVSLSNVKHACAWDHFSCKQFVSSSLSKWHSQKKHSKTNIWSWTQDVFNKLGEFFFIEHHGKPFCLMSGILSTFPNFLCEEGMEWHLVSDQGALQKLLKMRTF